MTEKHLTDQQFKDLSLAESLAKSVDEAGFTFCTPIQAQTLPFALQGKDVAGQAQTGTGKTIAFLLACCNRLLTKDPISGHQKGQPRALILAPTRELAIQIHKDAVLLNKHTGLSLGLVYGGTGYDQQKNMLAQGTDILIGTPGRLIDFFKQNLFSLEFCEVAVLDEADRMFDLGFIKDIRYLLQKMPEPQDRLNLLYSATLSFRVMELAYEHMNDPMEIKIESDEVVADKVNETSYYPATDEKLPLLVNLFKQENPERVLVFVNTKYAAENVSNALSANGINNAVLSGDVPQNKRERLLEQFKSGERKVLVATDVAARGLHIPAVSHVFNFDLPQDAEDYVHRIGRTARAGASGEAISFICEKYAYSIMDIEAYIGHSLPRKDIDSALLAAIEIPSRRASSSRSAKDKPSRSRERSRAPSSGKTTRNSAENQSEKLPQRNRSKSQQSNQDSAEDSQKDTNQNKGQRIIQQGDSQAHQTESSSQLSSNHAEPRPMIIPASTGHPPRFSRRFGEIPVIG